MRSNPARWIAAGLLLAAVLAAGFLAVAGTAIRNGAAAVPQDVTQLWADFDPREDPLEVEVVKRWSEGHIEYRLVLFTIGTFEGTKARMAAYYGFPKGGKSLPGHGRKVMPGWPAAR